MSKHHQQPQKRPEPPPPRDARPPDGAWWNGIRRLWLVNSDAGPVPLEPQPAPPLTRAEVPVAVKVHL